MSKEFYEAYEKWHNDCLKEFNEGYGRTFGVRKIHTVLSDDYDPDDLVEFAEDGSAYPHSVGGGTNYVPNAVTPWEQSIHYMN